ncbi:DHH family phosphoesterase [Candidatus Saccharibacteria bacterium]|nr:DHH family phosphoesterase [Candidatus Saccharibacteria bacterium]
MYENFGDFIKSHHRICIIQAENPDGDSLGSALALDYLLPDHEISLYCPVDLPKYLHYYPDWSRVSIEFDWRADAYIIVDTAASVLLSKLLDDSAIKNCLYSRPVFVLDHHETEDDLDFSHDKIIEVRPSCCDLIFDIAKANKLKVEKTAAEYLTYGILSDTLGLTSHSVTSATFRAVAELTDLGANVPELEENRREYMKKSQRILAYKADLIKRINYSLDGALATVHIPWEDIEEYSDEYNPNVLILEEMRMVEGVELAVAIKTYPDGKLTGKIRSSEPIADQVAGYFGGGGHPYAAGFRTYDLSYEDAVRELVSITPRLLSAAQKGAENATL